jgi:EAL domain-containing protein (putative c-di-GMP-specific phosphodiesterase class I)
LEKRVTSDLAKAIAAGEMDVWYQPQVASASLTIVGFEALARWNHPERGLLSPDAFFDEAEASTAELATFVLSRACADASHWPGLSVGVNVPPRQFADDRFPDTVCAIAAKAGLPLDRLELEILESSAFEQPDVCRAVMERLSAMGVQIAIDDFGQGWSHQALLLDLPVSKIKLARSIVTDEASAKWVGEFVATAHTLGMTVTAEGVETQAQAEAMQAAGCDYMQGYYFARPAPGPAIARALGGA